jgi:hypothetical protein
MELVPPLSHQGPGKEKTAAPKRLTTRPPPPKKKSVSSFGSPFYFRGSRDLLACAFLLLSPTVLPLSLSLSVGAMGGKKTFVPALAAGTLPLGQTDALQKRACEKMDGVVELRDVEGCMGGTWSAVSFTAEMEVTRDLGLQQAECAALNRDEVRGAWSMERGAWWAVDGAPGAWQAVEPLAEFSTVLTVSELWRFA